MDEMPSCPFPESVAYFGSAIQSWQLTFAAKLARPATPHTAQRGNIVVAVAMFTLSLHLSFPRSRRRVKGKGFSFN